MSVLDETLAGKEQVKIPFAPLKDYSLRHRVQMRWDLNADSTRDQMFILKVDDYEVVLDWEEMLRAGRFI